MTKYLIEGGIDFYKILQDSLNDLTEESQEQLCLISKSQLTEYSIKLECGHTFNYVPLYSEIVKQKFRPNNYTYNKNGIQCPYCRSNQSKLLPYYSELKLQLIHGVNTDNMFYKMFIDKRTKKMVYENTVHYVMNGQCCYKFTCTVDSNSNVEEDVLLCHNTCVISHTDTNKTYCSLHIQEAKKKYNMEKKENEKEEKKKKKMEKNQKIKEDKLKLKEEINQLKLQNKCCYLAGINTIQCKSKQYENQLCKKHFTKKNKKTEAKEESEN